MNTRILSALALATLLQGVPLTVMAQEPSGAYLAARQARYAGDFAAAAQYYAQALAEDPSNPAILEDATIAYLALGQLDRAVSVARKIEADGLESQVARMALVAQEARDAEWDALMARVQDGRGAGALADGLLAAWASLGKGDMTAALEHFDAVAEERGLRSFAIYHKALALASVGDFEGADKVFSGEADGPLQRTRRGVIAWAQVLSQIDAQERAVTVIDDTFGGNPDPEIVALRAALAAGERAPFDLVTGAADGVAEVFYSLGQALRQEANDDLILLYTRLAEMIKPDHIDAVLMSAELLERMERHDLATEAYKKVPREHPSYYLAELGRSDVLRRQNKPDAAAEVLEQLAQTHPDLPQVHVALGDLYRGTEEFAAAVTAYDRAVVLYDAKGDEQWFVLYARAISHERLDNWEKAEADFRRALELNPDHPQVLNYLGYTMVEKRINLDEALEMIERAVAAEPTSGYIVDSLGWVLYRLGRYDEAIGHMERAAELMPTDPVVNDHLGDVLWAVGRRVEARFQWKRALSLNESEPSSDLEPERIRRKLVVGLDQVLDEEGAAPLQVVNDGG
ncbi:Tetratricopeptide repeat-containing protein [Roseovarius azorensis]|uniref:Tetratricopeptide repeat-containing protein n=1 Tax=Roseovarius azorensis TaxID=1287727 RepID=A0A1H7IXK2_9RHOB|nr:tetratricopeptide repeat protein [Roseovarius azorensis]SEK66387.1 Tetratricopeptide repeat-containing protein [Roseovarius azorensis]